MSHEAVNVATHFIWLLLSVPATAVLWSRCRGNRPRQWAMLVYGVSLFLCAAGSTFYHASSALEAVDWASPSVVARFMLFDHVGIYLLIAGTCTPIIFTLMPGRGRDLALGAVWLAALVGVVVLFVENDRARWVSVGIYLLMGWGMGSTAPQLARSLPARDLRLIWIGGLLYTIGALAHARQWPTLWPDILGPHQILHLFVLAASATHFCFLLWYVAPFRQAVVAAPLPVAERRLVEAGVR